uniref:Thrombospondin type 1 domain protein n=1 Tax=Panagrolaimus sp. JU765 TaxID=591449 RepID=A0AC34PYC7_9BILA
MISATTAPTTTAATTTQSTTALTSAPVVSVTVAPGCEGTQWNTWMTWTDCTDTCGSCGLHQRFRSCNKTVDTCKCPGEAFQREYCNLAVCKYPREAPCCSGFIPFSQNGQFVCVANTTTTGRR